MSRKPAQTDRRITAWMRPFWRGLATRLSRKIALVALVPTVILVILLGIAGYVIAWHSILYVTQQALRQDAERHATDVQLKLRSILSSTRYMATSAALQTALTDSSGRQAYVAAVLDNLRQQLSPEAAVSLLDFDGSVLQSASVFSTPDPRGLRAWISKSMSSATESTAILPQAASATLWVLTPIFLARTRTVEGALVVSLPLKSVLPDAGATVTDSVQLLYVDPSDERTRSIDVLGTRPTDGTAGAASEHFTQVAQVAADPSFTALGLAVRVTAEAAAFTNRMRLVALIIISVSLVSVAGVGAIAAWSGRRLAARVEALERVAASILTEGLPNRRAAVSGDDEIARLASAFNNMLDRITTGVDQLHESERRFQTFLNNSPTAIYLKDIRGHYLLTNKQFTEWYGAFGDAIGKTAHDIWSDETAEIFTEQEREVLEQQRPIAREIEVPNPDGSVRATLVMKFPFLGPDGGPLGTGGIDVDVSQERRAEKERDRNRQFLDRVIENVPQIVLVKDAAEGRYLLANKAAEQFWSVPRGEIMGKTAADFFDQKTARLLSGHDEQALTGQKDVFVEEHPVRDIAGRMRYVTERRICIRSDDGKPQYLLAVIDDVTERRSVQEQLHQSQKMEAVGRLTGGLAHDFNNLLLIMIGNLDLLLAELRDNPSAAEKVQIVLQSSLRGAELTQQLLAFSRRQSLTPRRMDLNELIGNTSKLLQRTLGENITTDLKLADDLWPVAIDAAQLEAALVNVAINARDAMPNGGKLTIETRNARLDQDYCDKHTEVVPGDFVEIDVTDSGTGMPPEVLARVFEPFFTTKGQGRGTGLGLSTVFGFMRQSGGHIAAYSELGLGTTFKLYLPRATAQAQADAPPLATSAPDIAPGIPHETILVVEDNPTIRSMVVSQLEELGYHILQAENALDALDRLETDVIDLMFTDMVMPGGVNGKQLARIAGLKHPSLKVVFTSGFPGESGPGAELEPEDILLRKPYRKVDLAKVVRAVLDGRDCGPSLFSAATAICA